MGKKKPLCELSRASERIDAEEWRKWVLPPDFVCANCGRLANKKKRLCKPKKL